MTITMQVQIEFNNDINITDQRKIQSKWHEFLTELQRVKGESFAMAFIRNGFYINEQLVEEIL